MMSMIRIWLLRQLPMVAMALAATLLCAANPDAKTHQPEPSQAGETVEMFSAIKEGRIEVKLIPKDSTVCGVLIENKTTKPLTVQMPETFAGVPVLAQFGGMSGTNGSGRRGGTSGNQGIGGGFGGMRGMGRGGMGGGIFNIPPEKVVKTDVPIVCLDHGKRDPRPKMKYEIKPVEAYTDHEAVPELLRLLGNGSLPQRTAQAAAWHLNNNMSWQQLMAKELRFANGIRRPYFSQDEIRAAMQASNLAICIAKEHENSSQPSNSSTSPSEK